MSEDYARGMEGFEGMADYESADTTANVICTCPHCGGDVIEAERLWKCSNKDCRYGYWKDNRFFRAFSKELTADMVKQLSENGYVRLNDCISRRTGKQFDTIVKVETDDRGATSFRLEFEH